MERNDLKEGTYRAMRTQNKGADPGQGSKKASPQADLTDL